MASGFNQIVLVGYLGRAPEMRYTPTGKPVASFSIVSTHDAVSSDGVHHQEIDWFNVVAWGPLAEECKEHLSKGQQVLIEGHVKNRRWTNESQAECSCAEVVAQRLVPFEQASMSS